MANDIHQANEPVVEEKELKNPMKKPSRFGEVFSHQDRNDIFEFLLSDVVVPALKHMAEDTITKGVHMMLFGDANAPSPSHRGGGRQNTRYNDIPPRTSARWVDLDFGPGSFERTRRQELNSIDLTKEEAQDALQEMEEVSRAEGMLSILDYLDILGYGQFTEPSDESYGWTRLMVQQATIERSRRTRNAYHIMMPTPKLLPSEYDK